MELLIANPTITETTDKKASKIVKLPFEISLTNNSTPINIKQAATTNN